MSAVPSAYDRTPLPTVNAGALPTSEPRRDSPWSHKRRMSAPGLVAWPLLDLDIELAEDNVPRQSGQGRPYATDLAIMNDNDKCEGLWTRVNTRKKDQKSVLDYVTTTRRTGEKITSMIIDEDGLYVPTRYKAN